MDTPQATTASLALSPSTTAPAPQEPKAESHQTPAKAANDNKFGHISASDTHASGVQNVHTAATPCSLFNFAPPARIGSTASEIEHTPVNVETSGHVCISHIPAELLDTVIVKVYSTMSAADLTNSGDVLGYEEVSVLGQVKVDLTELAMGGVMDEWLDLFPVDPEDEMDSYVQQVYGYAHTCTHTHRRTRICMRIYKCMHVCVCTRIYVCMYACICKHIHIHTCIYTHVHICLRLCI